MSQAEPLHTASVRPAPLQGGKRGVRRFLLRAEAGAVGGLIAGIAVALLFLVQSAIQLHPLSVPANLATGLFASDTSSAGRFGQVGSDVILGFEMLAYTVVHLLAFAAVGASAVLVLDGTGFWKSVLGGAAFAATACTGLLYMVRWFANTPVALDVVGLPRVLMANALAGAIIGIAIYMAEHGETSGSD